MRSGLKEVARQIARWSAGLLLMPVGILTSVLFFATGRIAPESYTSWADLGCSPADKVMVGGLAVDSPTQFVGLTDCGRAYIVRNLGDRREQPASPSKTTLYDVFTNDKLGTVGSDGRFFQSFLSRDRRNLLMDVRGNAVILRDLVSGRDLAKTTATEDYQQSSLNKSANIALIRSDSGGAVWDMASGKQISSFRLPRKAVSFSFCDREGHAKCLTKAEGIEIVNEETGAREFVLKAKATGVGEAFQFSSDYRRMANVDNKIRVWSLEDGLVTRTIPASGSVINSNSISSGSAMVRSDAGLTFSNNACWLAQEYSRRNRILGWKGWNGNLWDFLSFWLPAKDMAVLIDLETGKTWPGMPAGHGVAFSEDDAKMVSFADDGKYVWTVPPRWQYFTPWAWAALGTWLGLISIWWKLRKPTRVAA